MPSFEYQNEFFKFKASSDEELLKLFIDIEVVSRKKVITAEMLSKALQESVPEDLLDRGVLSDIAKTLQTQNKLEHRRVAKGTESIKGMDGKLVFLKRRLSKEPNLATVDETAFVSLKDLGLFENIRIGEPVARIYPPKEGTPGLSVFGDVLPAKTGESVIVKIDEKTLLQESAEKIGKVYDLVVSQVDGYLEEQNTKLLMKEEFVVGGDLDGSTGNLNFVGEISITGDVPAGFIVSGEKGVVVKGNVNKAEIYSEKGPILIEGRVFGENKAKLIAAKRVSCRSVQDATLEAGTDLFILEESRFSTLRALGTLQAHAAKIFGGKGFFAAGALIGEFGNQSDVVSEILLGSEAEISTEFQLLLKSIEDHEKLIELLVAHLGPYATNPDRIQLLAKHLRPKMEALLTKKVRAEGSLKTLLEKKELLLGASELKDGVHLSIQTFFHRHAALQLQGIRYEAQEREDGPFSIVLHSETEELNKVEFQVVEPVENLDIKKG